MNRNKKIFAILDIVVSLLAIGTSVYVLHGVDFSFILHSHTSPIRKFLFWIAFIIAVIYIIALIADVITSIHRLMKKKEGNTNE